MMMAAVRRKTMLRLSGGIRAAAEQGDVAAQFNLGIMFANGHGVAKDEGEAFRWFMEAAARGNLSAMFNVAVPLFGRPRYWAK